MKRTQLLFLLLFTLISQLAFSKERETILLNDDWNFVFGYEVQGNAGVKVQLPHTWNNEDALSGKLDYFRGDGSYYKKIHIDSAWKGKRLFLKFEGANTVTDLFINFKHIGEHRGGYNAFIFEITDCVNYGEENQFRIRVSNARHMDVMPLVGDFSFYGGIYRDLNLIITNESCISPLDYASPGVYLEQKGVSKENATVNSRILVSNGSSTDQTYEVGVEVREGNKLILAKKTNLCVARNSESFATIPFFISNPRLWNARKDPFSYDVRVTLKKDGELLDVVDQPLGLRYFLVDENLGFFLNGEHMKLKGVCRHQDREYKGNAISQADHDEDMAIIMEMGANAVRLSHYPHAAYFYDLLDKNGIIAWSEIPFVGPGGYREQGFMDMPAFRKNGRQQLKEMIRQNFNRPSVCFWGLFNELKFDEESPIEYVNELNILAKSEDPSRLTVSASFIDKAEINEITDLIGWNKYFGWYTGAPEDIGPWIDKIHKESPSLKVSISEYGSGASIIQHQEKIEKPKSGGRWHPESWQAYCHEKNWQEINKRQFIWGSFIWNLFDFTAVHRKEGDRLGLNDKGLVTLDRKVKKDAWWFYKASWNMEDPVLYITDRRFTNRKSNTTYVKAYSNQNEVELFVNGHSLGKKSVKDAVVQWNNVRLQKGKNLIEVKSHRDNISDSCVWKLE